MKRVGNLFGKLIADENLAFAIREVNRTHRWTARHKPNRIVQWVEETEPDRIAELRAILTEGFEPKPTKHMRRYDKSAGKWRDIEQPALWPDQYIHHALVQIIQPVVLRGMDGWCCGSVPGRGIHYGVKGIKKWMKNDVKGTKWCAELDIRHFYQSVAPDVVMGQMRRLIKDRRVLDLIRRMVDCGVGIGLYTSQWFANAVLQPLDVAIRSCGVSHYVRYMDNMTVFARSKKTLDRVIKTVSLWLAKHGMELKKDWQKFPVKSRMPKALGYRYGRGFTLLRKKNLLALKRKLAKIRKAKHISPKMAAGVLSRLGQLRHCQHNSIYRSILFAPKLQKRLKDVVREGFV